MEVGLRLFCPLPIFKHVLEKWHPIIYNNFCYRTVTEEDYSAAIENMLLTIVELGYQSCWYEGHITDEDRICDKIADILLVPKDYEVVCILPVGVAESEPLVPKKKVFEERAWFNTFKGR